MLVCVYVYVLPHSRTLLNEELRVKASSALVFPVNEARERGVILRTLFFVREYSVGDFGTTTWPDDRISSTPFFSLVSLSFIGMLVPF